MTFRSKTGVAGKWLKRNWAPLSIIILLVILFLACIYSLFRHTTDVYVFTDTTGQQGMSSYCWIGKSNLVCRKGSTGFVEVREYSKVVKSEDL